MVIKDGNSDAMHKLGHYYHKRKEYDLMLKYYSQAIDMGNSSSIYMFGYYYVEQKQYDSMKKILF